jgi:prophage regulatory protein
MRSRRLPIDATTAVLRRAGGVRGTRPGSGSPTIARGDSESFEERRRPLPQLLEVRQLAHILGIGRTKAYELIEREEIPVIRVGRCVRVPVDELRAWISSRVVVPLESQDRS